MGAISVLGLVTHVRSTSPTPNLESLLSIPTSTTCDCRNSSTAGWERTWLEHYGVTVSQPPLALSIDGVTTIALLRRDCVCLLTPFFRLESLGPVTMDVGCGAQVDRRFLLLPRGIYSRDMQVLSVRGKRQEQHRMHQVL